LALLIQRFSNNHRPRKSLGWKTPNELLHEKVAMKEKLGMIF
jgi:IS30 family transposase